jgi:hypothetical protein
MLDAMIDGERDAQVLAEVAKTKLGRKISQPIEALDRALR